MGGHYTLTAMVFITTLKTHNHEDIKRHKDIYITNA